MKIARFVCLGGRVLPLTRARMSPLDRGFLYGDGAFESMRVMDGRVLEWEEHLRRLYGSAWSLRIPLRRTCPPEKLKSSLAALLRKNGLRDALVRLSFTRGEASWWGLWPGNVKGRPSVAMFAVPFNGYPEEKYEKGAAMITSTWRHMPPEVLPPKVKSLNYLGGVLAMDEAVRKGADEALVLTLEGLVAEGTHSTVFWVHKNTIHTPPLRLGILPGITRARAMQLAAGLGFALRETAAPRSVLNSAAEVFYTNTSSWVMPVTRLDGKKVGKGRMGPVTRLLLTAFRVHYASAR